MSTAHEKDEYALRAGRILAFLGNDFSPHSIEVIAQRVFPDHPAWTQEDSLEKPKELYALVSNTLAALVMEHKVMRVGKRRWARRTSWKDWRDWLCVVMDAASDGDSKYEHVAKDALEYWSRRVPLSYGPGPEDWEPVAIQAITLYCTEEGLREPWVLMILRRCAAVVWRAKTAREIGLILEQSLKLTDRALVQERLKELRDAVGRGRCDADGGT